MLKQIFENQNVRLWYLAAIWIWESIKGVENIDFIKILCSSSVLKRNLADSKLLKNYYQPTASIKHLFKILLSIMDPVVNIFPTY